MLDDQILEEPDSEEEEEEPSQEERLAFELERLAKALLPPVGEQEIEELLRDLGPLASAREELIEKITAAIERGNAALNKDNNIG